MSKMLHFKKTYLPKLRGFYTEYFKAKGIKGGSDCYSRDTKKS